MQVHPSRRDPHLAHLLTKYPKTSSSLFQAYNDVTFAQRWTQVETIDLPNLQRGAIRGLRPSLDPSDSPKLFVVLPCSLTESLNTSLFKNAFSILSGELQHTGSEEPEALFLAVCAEDSSIVYYKISNGIVKPPI